MDESSWVEFCASVAMCAWNLLISGHGIPTPINRVHIILYVQVYTQPQDSQLLMGERWTSNCLEINGIINCLSIVCISRTCHKFPTSQHSPSPIFSDKINKRSYLLSSWLVSRHSSIYISPVIIHPGLVELQSTLSNAIVAKIFAWKVPEGLEKCVDAAGPNHFGLCNYYLSIADFAVSLGYIVRLTRRASVESLPHCENRGEFR